MLRECTHFYPHSIPNVRKWFEKKHLNYTLFRVFKFFTLFLFFRLSLFQPVFFICSVEVAFRFLNLKTPFVDNSCHSWRDILECLNSSGVFSRSIQYSIIQVIICGPHEVVRHPGYLFLGKVCIRHPHPNNSWRRIPL